MSTNNRTTEIVASEWWRLTLERDKYATRYKNGRIDLLQCVFCQRTVVPNESSDAMLAWWTHRDDIDGQTIFAAGFYCHGLRCGGRCLDVAKRVGHLLDVHAEHAIGELAWVQLDRIVEGYNRWESDALRRIVRIARVLSTFKRRNGG